jgi:hypothetical protein
MGKQGRRAGSVTIALNEIDDMTRREAGSSSESILPKDERHQGKVQQSEAGSIGKSDNPEYHAIGGLLHLEPAAIRVERTFSIDYNN